MSTITHEQIYNKFFGYAMQVAMEKIRRNDIAKDYAQESMVNLLNQIDKGKYEYLAEKSFESWCKSVIKNRIIDFIRKENTSKHTKLIPTKEGEIYVEESDEADDNEDILWHKESERKYKKLLQAAKELTPARRKVFYYYYVKDYKVKKVAEFIGNSESGVRRDLLRARNDLKRIMDEMGEGDFRFD